MKASALWVVVFSLGCGSPQARPPETTQSRTPDPAAGHDARRLTESSSFADLVALARERDRLRDQDSARGCLLQAEPPFVLAADLAVALRPLPTAIEPRVSASLAVLTRYGRVGPADATDLFVAFTTTAPRPSATPLVLVVGLGDLTLLTPGAPPRPVTTLQPAPDELLFVTAAPTVPLARLASVLRSLPGGLEGRVGLAIQLPEGTRPPIDATREPPPSEPACDALPEGDDAGELPIAALHTGFARLADRVAACSGASEGPGASGGRVLVRVRIGPDGAVHDACVGAGIDDGPLRACITRHARELRFEPPTGGSVVVEVPLALAPAPAMRQVPLCDGAP